MPKVSHHHNKKGGAIAKLAFETTRNVGATAVGVECDIKNLIINQIDKEEEEKTEDATIRFVEANIIGRDLTFEGPFGRRKVVYCDYTASGKSLKFIEDYIQDQVLPYYGNTHTTTSVSSLHTSSLRHEAKDVIRHCLNCTDDDAVIFVSSGTTGAINKLIHGLKLTEKPVVFISPYEHHSNILPWLEIGAEIVYGDEDHDGLVDLQALENSLKEYSKLGRPMIGSYSAASNITGILTDTDAVSILLHKYGAYAFFDFASAGPYVEIDMNTHLKNPSKGELCYKDAMFCSIHKFVGGPETPGLLVAKKSVFVNPVPSGVGGGTVVFVTHKSHQYVSDIEEREEGGTPAIVESIRAGLVFQLKEEVTTNLILKLEHKWVMQAYKRWEPIKNLYILGKSSAERLPIFSLCIIHPESGRFLHHNFVSALLNDLFGIQARGGCACAGPYAEDLLGMSSVNAAKIAEVITGNFKDWEEIDKKDLKKVEGKKFTILKPGFTRLNLPYFFDQPTIDYILDAVAFVAKHGWKLLPMYHADAYTGDFKFKEKFKSEIITLKDAQLKHISSNGVCVSYEHLHHKTAMSYKDALEVAKKKVDKFYASLEHLPNTDGFQDQFLPDSLNDIMRWFLLPSEVVLYAQGKMPTRKHKPFFFPRGHKQENPARRTRLKSGSIYAKFCNCPVSNKRHLQNEDCREYFHKKLEEDQEIMRAKKELEAINENESEQNEIADTS